MKATIEEYGNGLPVAGDYVPGGGYLYRVVSIDSRIQINAHGGHYVHATVEEADWDDCPEGSEFAARCTPD